MADLSKMAYEDLAAEHEKLGDQMRELELKKMDLGAELGRRHLESSVSAEVDTMDPARVDAMARIATIRAQQAPQDAGANA